jgi:uroporphyrinogen-III synthase
VAAAEGDREPAADALAERRVLVTRPAHQAADLADRIAALGGHPVVAPTVATGPGDPDRLDAAVLELARGAYAGLCLTSVNGVAALASAFARTELSPDEVLGDLRLVGAVGPRTAAELRLRLEVDATVVPDRATGAALGAAVPPGIGRVLLPRGDRAGQDLPDALTAAGWVPVPVVAYRTVTARSLPADVLDQLSAGGIDLLTFTSASTVRGFVELVADRPWTGRVVTIGPVTSTTAREFGLPVAAEADPHDVDGLVAALVRAATA